MELNMFNFLKKSKPNKQLEDILQRLHMNASNNYKDAAQANLKEFENILKELTESGELSEAQKLYYGEKLSAFQNEMKNFSHLDQNFKRK